MEGTVISVSVGTLGQPTRSFALAEGSTVQDLLDIASVSAQGMTIRIAGNGDVTTDTALENGDVVVLVPNVKNGR